MNNWTPYPNMPMGYTPQSTTVPTAYPQQQSVQSVTKVHGEDEARAFPLGALSSVLLLDDTDPILYIKATDRNGALSAFASYNIELRKSPQDIITELTDRINRLEARLNEQPNTGLSNQSKRDSSSKSGNADAK